MILSTSPTLSHPINVCHMAPSSLDIDMFPSYGPNKLQ
jgi:hypothetical protein